MKLWTATFEVTVVVAAEQKPSEYAMKNCAEYELQYNDPGCWGVNEITSVGNVPDNWLDQQPYLNGRTTVADRTCEEFLLGTVAEREAAEEARLEAVRNAPMPNQMELPLP